MAASNRWVQGATAILIDKLGARFADEVLRDLQRLPGNRSVTDTLQAVRDEIRRRDGRRPAKEGDV